MDSLNANGPVSTKPGQLHTAQGKENFATRTAALIIPAVGNNYLRHEKLQRFMLANDSVTVAVEVPIWLTRPDITALERHHGIRLLPEGAPADQTITGHIDFLQIRNGAVHILDYKPDARTNRPFAQLTIYARPGPHPARRPSPLRYQVRLVQRGPVLRILSAHGARPHELRLPPCFTLRFCLKCGPRRSDYPLPNLGRIEKRWRRGAYVTANRGRVCDAGARAGGS